MEELLNTYCAVMGELQRAEQVAKEAEEMLKAAQFKRDQCMSQLVKVMKDCNCWTIPYRYMGQDYAVMLQMDSFNNSQIVIRPLSYSESITSHRRA